MTLIPMAVTIWFKISIITISWHFDVHARHRNKHLKVCCKGQFEIVSANKSHCRAYILLWICSSNNELAQDSQFQTSPRAAIIRVCSMQCSRLLVDEEMLELIEGKYSKLNGGLRATWGKSPVPDIEEGREVGVLIGLIVTSASIGSETKAGHTCTFSFVMGRAARGKAGERWSEPSRELANDKL
jgi:hypothetical protein